VASELPLWFGAERGTDILSLVEWEDEEVTEPGGGFMDDFAAGMLGLLAPLALLALLAAAAPAGVAVLVGLLGALWLGAGIAAAVLVATAEDDPPFWAAAFTKMLATLGKIIAVLSIVIIVLVGLAMLLALVFGALASSDR
jgi:hypothetical protein